MSKATFLLITRFALQNTTSNSVEKKESSPRGRSEKRGLGEIPSRPSEYKKRIAQPCLFRAEFRTKVFFSF